jgi:hypothetical protein
MKMNLSSEVKLIKIKDHSASGTSTITSDAVDTQGYEGVLLFTSFGTPAANTTIKAQQSSDDGNADDYSDLLGSSVASGTSDEDCWIDIYRPAKRYVKLLALPAGTSTVESMWAILYGPRTMPVDNTISGTIIGEAFASPAEGTA